MRGRRGLRNERLVGRLVTGCSRPYSDLVKLAFIVETARLPLSSNATYFYQLDLL